MSDKKDSGFHWVRDSNGKKHWVMKGTDPDLWVTPTRAKFPCTKSMLTAISQKVAEGNTIADIGRMQGFPPATVIYNWLQQRPDFKVQIKGAREIRGFVMEEKALEAAEASNEKNVQSQKLRTETYKWAAEVNNPEIYGKRTKVVGDPTQPVSFVIDTGIVREPKDEVPKLGSPPEGDT